jgi:hypothetical protein
MNFYGLTSIVAAQKQSVPLHESTDSFCVAANRTAPYIEPTLSKIEFEQEKPAIILISAVGATGKTTLAQVLSSRTGLPLLDLAKHKAVGDYSLTGLLTSAFRSDDFTKVLEGIGRGTFGVIIDGIDEGRSKTNEGAFEAFLDDIARLCKNASTPSFVLLGRTQILDTCWLYLTEKGIKTGLLTISPFDLTQARGYIDTFTGGLSSNHAKEYQSVRDLILEKLGAAFGVNVPENDQNFLSFIGYPPVLDAIVTLLGKEQNYYGLREQLAGAEVKDIEIELLYRIASYILEREREQKVVPNILEPLIADMPSEERVRIRAHTFGTREQCVRLVSYCLGRKVSLAGIGLPHIDEKYETQLWSFLPEHPFIAGRSFQNAIFEAFATSMLILSPDQKEIDLALEYVDAHKYNYHLVYLLHLLASNTRIPIRVLRVVLGSALEFRTRTATVEVEIEATEPASEGSSAENVDIGIEVVMGAEEGQSRTFTFRSGLTGVQSVNLGHRLASTFASLPCEVILSNSDELEFMAPVVILATKISLQSRTLTLRAPTVEIPNREVLLQAESLESSLERIVTNGVELILEVTDRTGLTYPVIQFVEEKKQCLYDPLQKEKYMRLRRILVLFRSHSRGTLARYKQKIENKRVLGNDIGEKVLKQLLRDGILTLSGTHYFLQPENVNKHLGVSWADLRKGRSSPKLLQYLLSIN